ncbi:MAG TPA: hypothetical protein ENK83_03575 [Aliiroseovarius sp.]|nr:hypothetical protein [Aliiroseovarius sp.]
MPEQDQAHAKAGVRTGLNPLALGTVVYTLDGALPVEYLNDGDRVITRSGARVVRAIEGDAALGFALRFDRPQIVYTENAQVVMA